MPLGDIFFPIIAKTDFKTEEIFKQKFEGQACFIISCYFYIEFILYCEYII